MHISMYIYMIYMCRVHRTYIYIYNALYGSLIIHAQYIPKQVTNHGHFSISKQSWGWLQIKKTQSHGLS